MSVPDRSTPLLGAALNVTAPLPDPDAGLVIMIQSTPLAAVHVQLGSDAVIVIEPEPPAAGTIWLAGAIEYVHTGGAAF